VKQSGGYIWVYSEPGQGTTFKLYFPVVEAAVAATTTTHSNSMTAASGQIMLLVENEDLIRSNMRECLRQMGYRVLEAANAEDALEIARLEKGAIDLLLTDLVLTGMRGDELAKEFANLHPHAGVLFMSGYTEETAARRDIFEAGSSFLQKPFSVADLAHAVSAALSVATSEI
jgi:DNA-binding NtrC family response regulator